MYETFKRFEKLQFGSRCLSCGRQIEPGVPAYGSSRHGPTGKWVFVCLDCHARDMKATSAPMVEESDEVEAIDPAVLELFEERARSEQSTATGATTSEREETKHAARPFLEVIREQARWRLASS